MARLGALVIAAGDSKRMGEPKQLLSFGSKTLLDLAISAVTLPEFDRIALVLGANAELVREKHWLDECEIFVNDDWSKGMITSIQAGLRPLAASCDWVLVHLCDYALVERETIARLLLRALAPTQPQTQVVTPIWQGQSGHPIVLGRETFKPILDLNPELGLDAVVAAFSVQRERVEVRDPCVCLDIDTPEDYQRALAAWQAREAGDESVVKVLMGG
ncbi:MAG: nucleotidyltransferase family protein [Planctomycetes bacterium]|nr:nucleotidyltransferase family protein [Planctomycetota bacterium]